MYEFKSRSMVIKLISYVENGALTEEGFQLLCETLAKFKEKAVKFECAKIHCFATAAMRRLSDPSIVIEQVRLRTGIEIQLLSGIEEAELSWYTLLARDEGKATSGLLIDIGGGSTEITTFAERATTHRVSFPFGALSLLESHNTGAQEFLNENERQSLRQTVAEIVSNENLNIVAEHVFLLGGTTKAMGTLIRLLHKLEIKKLYKLSHKNNFHKTEMFRFNEVFTFSHSQFKQLCEEFSRLDKKRAVVLRNFFPKRYMLVLPALDALEVILKDSGVEFIHIIPGGIRDGFICKLHDQVLKIINPKSL